MLGLIEEKSTVFALDRKPKKKIAMAHFVLAIANYHHRTIVHYSFLNVIPSSLRNPIYFVYAGGSAGGGWTVP